jgi:hypothetical protein
MTKLDNVAYILMELVVDDGKEALDPLYDLIAAHPGSTSFTASAMTLQPAICGR